MGKDKGKKKHDKKHGKKHDKKHHKKEKKEEPEEVPLLDPNSLADASVRQKHLAFDLDIDFENQRFIGSVTIQFRARTSVKTFALDTKALTIAAVRDGDNKLLRFRLRPDEPPFGRALEIHLDSRVHKGDKFSVTIEYETSPLAIGLQWLDPSLTEGKKHPYVFSQFQAIHARSFVPCQDTPSAKATYEAVVRAPSHLTVLMSALGLGKRMKSGGVTEFYFAQKVKIATYLIAIVCGNLVGKVVGPISTVWCEPEQLEAAAYEFAEVDTFIQHADRITDYPYRKLGWGKYDILVLPGSFPYGGMENPSLTFVTPTLLAGDRSATNVIAHELAHSWFGNCVTNKTWECFWMNEGFTVWLEDKIQGSLYGSKTRDMALLMGNTELQRSLDAFSAHPAALSLVTDLTCLDPDDYFSSIPYNKGAMLLYWLEKAIVKDSKLTFEKCIQAWIRKNIQKNVTSEMFRDFFEDFYADEPDVCSRLPQIPWHAWFYDRDPRGCPVDVLSLADDSLMEQAKQLAAQWLETGAKGRKESDVADMTPDAKVVFIRALEHGDISPEAFLAMDKLYKFSQLKHPEVLFETLRLALKLKVAEESYAAGAEAVLRRVGRMKYVLPLFKVLVAFNRERAMRLYEETSRGYHPICVKMLKPILGL